MVLNYASKADSQVSTNLMDNWMAVLQKNSKSEAQLQSEMLEGVTEQIKKVREEAIENAKEEKAAQDGTTSDTTAKPSSDGIKAPSEITSADLQSPIDIKL